VLTLAYPSTVISSPISHISYAQEFPFVFSGPRLCITPKFCTALGCVGGLEVWHWVSPGFIGEPRCCHERGNQSMMNVRKVLVPQRFDLQYIPLYTASCHGGGAKKGATPSALKCVRAKIENSKIWV
jgi:hypothetical protein